MTTTSRGPARAHKAPPGIRVGDYDLQYRLGEGGMGVVHLAADPDGHRVALKVLRPHIVGDEEARDRLAREVNSLVRVKSPWVAEIIDSDPWGPVPFVATRYVPGPSLHEHVRSQGRIKGDDLLLLARGLAEALQACHRVGVLHRDVKPSNVLLEGRRPVLIDFGLARVADDATITQTGWLIGTPGYLAPEILHGETPTPASDVHSWAATVAFAGMGKAPFGKGPSAAVMDRVRRGEHEVRGLPEPLQRLVVDSLDPQTRRRPTIEDILDVLGAAPRTRRAQIVDDGVVPTSVFPVDDPSEFFRSTEPTAHPSGRRTTTAPQREPYQAPPPPADAGPGAVERLRRFLLGLAAVALVAAGVAVAPYVTGGLLVVAVTMLRWWSTTGSSISARRAQRGSKWYDAPLALVASPVDLLVSLPGTMLLLLLGGMLAASAGLIGVALGWTDAEMLLAAGGVLGLSLWAGPGAGRVRRAGGVAGYPVARSFLGWALVLALLGGAAGALGWLALDRGADWAPFDEAPWQSSRVQELLR